MNLPHILHAGVFRKPERYRQIKCQTSISFNVKGLKRSICYYPDGKVRWIYEPEKGAFLSIGLPGMTVDFEYGSDRENYVIAFDCPEIQYGPDGHGLFLNRDHCCFELPPCVWISNLELPVLRNQCQTLVQLFRTALPRDALKADFLLNALLARYLADPAEYVPDPVGKMRRLIDQDLECRLPLAQISRECGLHRDAARQAFQKQYHISPGEYRIRRRIQRMIFLMSSSSMSMKEIAGELGMKHASHLNSFVKQHFGKTPGELYRECGRYESASFNLPADPTEGPVPEYCRRFLGKHE